ncbi:MAG: lysine 2,3-aminomutase, partial [Roseococcus sp.]
MNRTLRSAGELAAAGLLPPEAVPALAPVEARYAVAVTAEVAVLIRAGHAEVARQYLPDPAELLT